MNKLPILFFYLFFVTAFVVGSDNNSGAINFKKRLDRVFERNGLGEYNTITSMSQRIADEPRTNKELTAAVFLTTVAYKEYLRGQVASTSQKESLSAQQEWDLSQKVLGTFDSKKDFIDLVAKHYNKNRSSLMQNSNQDTDDDTDEFTRLLPSGLLDDSDQE